MRSLAKSLFLTENEIAYLELVSRTENEYPRRRQRANILILADKGVQINDIAGQCGLPTTAITKLLKKALTVGVEEALNDLSRSGTPTKRNFEDIVRIVYIACEKPSTFGYTQKVWSFPLLAKHIRDSAEQSSHPALSTISHSTVWEILNKLEIKLGKGRNYSERSPLEPDDDLQKVLVVYQKLDKIYLERNYEYKKLGPVHFLAGLNLNTGEVYALASETYKNVDFNEFLKQIDKKIGSSQKVRVLLDQHRSEVSEIGTFFENLTQLYLRSVRVSSKDELISSLYAFIDIINKYPVAHNLSVRIEKPNSSSRSTLNKEHSE